MADKLGNQVSGVRVEFDTESSSRVTMERLLLRSLKEMYLKILDGIPHILLIKLRFLKED